MIRSENMVYYNLVMSKEASWEILNRIGQIESLHFQDMQPEIIHSRKNLIYRPSFFLKCKKMWWTFI